MLKIVVALLSLALLSEAADVRRLHKMERLRSRADEINKLKSRYSNLITYQPHESTVNENSTIHYTAALYRGNINLNDGGETLTLIFDTGSFHNMCSKGFLDDDLYSFCLRHSDLVLGGIESHCYTGEISYVPLTSESNWQIQIDASVMGFNLCTGCEAIVDTGTFLTSVPNFQYENVMRAVGATFNRSKNIYTLDCSITDQLPSFDFLIGGRIFSLKPEDYIIEADGVCFTAFENIGTNEWILGNIFTEKYYTVLDLANKRVGFALSNQMAKVNASIND